MRQISSKITLARKRKGEKERTRRKKGKEQKKAMVSLLAFILRMFWPKKLLDRVGLLFGGNFFKNSARLIFEYLM